AAPHPAVLTRSRPAMVHPHRPQPLHAVALLWSNPAGVLYPQGPMKSRWGPTMPSNHDTKNDPHDVLEIAPDVVLVARAAAEFPSLAPDTASQPFARQPNMGNMGAGPDLAAAPRVDTTFRASDVDDIPGLRSGARWL